LKDLQVNLNPASERRDGESARIKPNPLLGIALLVVIVLGFALTNLFGGQVPRASALPQMEAEKDGSWSQNYQFVGQGAINGGTEREWLVGKVPIQIDENTQIIGDLHAGDFVNVSGRRLNDQVWIADRIESITKDQSFFIYNGSIQRVQASVWKIGGYNLILNSQTVVDRSLKLDDLALVTFFVNQDGAWIALDIRLFDPRLIQPTPTQTPVPTPTESPPNNILSTKPDGPSAIQKDGREKDHKKGKKKKDKRDKNHHNEDHDEHGGKHDD
jgi:hypothetical protein